jgi:hypothetical protein
MVTVDLLRIIVARGIAILEIVILMKAAPVQTANVVLSLQGTRPVPAHSLVVAVQFLDTADLPKITVVLKTATLERVILIELLTCICYLDRHHCNICL